MDFLEVTKAQYVGGHKIHLWFNNDVDKVVDFSDLLVGSAFEPLKDEEYFKWKQDDTELTLLFMRTETHSDLL